MAKNIETLALLPREHQHIVRRPKGGCGENFKNYAYVLAAASPCSSLKRVHVHWERRTDGQAASLTHTIPLTIQRRQKNIDDALGEYDTTTIPSLLLPVYCTIAQQTPLMRGCDNVLVSFWRNRTDAVIA